MTDDDVTQLKSSCFTAAAFIGVTALALGLMFHTMLG
jgi:hypothetical protein